MSNKCVNLHMQNNIVDEVAITYLTIDLFAGHLI